MRKVFFLILVFNSLIALSQTKDITGIWFSEVAMRIQSNEQVDWLESDSLEETPVCGIDTFYHNIAFFIKIEQDGTFYGFAGNTKKGKWKLVNEKVEFQIDTMFFKGVFENDKLVLIAPAYIASDRILMKKVSIPTKLEWNPKWLKRKYMTVDLNDSLKYGFHFLNKNSVIINKVYKGKFRVLDWGEWETYKFNNYILLNIFNRTSLENYYYVIFKNESASLKAMHTLVHFPKKGYTFYDNIEIKNECLLSKSNIESNNSMLQGDWQAINDFYPKDSLIIEEELIKDFYYHITFSDNTFSINYGGKGKSKNYERIVKGNWKLGETGNYLILNYTINYHKESFKTTRYIAIDNLTNDSFNLTTDIRAINNDRISYGGIDLNLEKIK